MALGVAEKIIQNHLVSGKLEPGEEVTIKVDQTLTQDATGTMAYLQFEAIKVSEIRTELAVSYVDHNTMQEGPQNADDHRYLQTIAAKYGIYFSRPGNGICHQVHLERFAQPGKTLLGSDSHTPTAGAMGMFAIGVGGGDVAVGLATGEYSFLYPHIIHINFKGKLKKWVSAKDVILTILKKLTSKGNADSMIEYGGDGLKHLSIPERATIANMGAEIGVITSLFPSDEIAREFLQAQGRDSTWQKITGDPEALYKRTIEIDLDEIIPMIACPHSPDNVVPVCELEGKKVDQVIIGSCTNSSYHDLKIVGSILKGKKIHHNVSLMIAPSSRQVLKMIADEGILSAFIEAGARIGETTCGFCIGSGHAPATGAVSIRTSNRNFKGRCGTPQSFVYLTSPETAAITAITGVITNPQNLDKEIFPSIKLPDKFFLDDSLIIPPFPKEKRNIEIYRGPNIGELPRNEPLPEIIKGKIAIKVGDKITTDDIMPAGSKLKFRSNIPKYAESVFEGVDPSFPRRCRENKSMGYSNIIVAGETYGQGSSREHAAICPMYLGVKAVIAQSFERIHRANLINFGILPLTFQNVSDYELIELDDIVEIAAIRERLEQSGSFFGFPTAHPEERSDEGSHEILQPFGLQDDPSGKNKKRNSSSGQIILNNVTKGIEIQLDSHLTKKEVKLILAGGILNYIKERINDYRKLKLWGQNRNGRRET